MRNKRSIIQSVPVILALVIFSPGMAAQAFAASAPAKTVVAPARSEPAGVQRGITLHPSDEGGPGWTEGYIDGKGCAGADPGAYESFPDENFESNYYAGYDQGAYESGCY